MTNRHSAKRERSRRTRYYWTRVRKETDWRSRTIVFLQWGASDFHWSDRPKARVAKGTFYLYFHDKVQLINHLIVKESSSIINDALWPPSKELMINWRTDFLIDHVIAYFADIRRLSSLIQKNLSWNLVGGKLKEDDNYEVEYMNSYCDFLYTRYTRSEAYQLLFLWF